MQEFLTLCIVKLAPCNGNSVGLNTCADGVASGLRHAKGGGCGLIARNAGKRTLLTTDTGSPKPDLRNSPPRELLASCDLCRKV
jgi:hypothetical protein